MSTGSCCADSADLADDLTADTFAAAFRQRDRFDASRGTVRPWLFGIAANLIGKHRRSEMRVRSFDLALKKQNQKIAACGSSYRVLVAVDVFEQLHDLLHAGNALYQVGRMVRFLLGQQAHQVDDWHYRSRP